MSIFGKLFGHKKEKEEMPGLEGLGHDEKAPEGWGMPELGPAPQAPTQPEQPAFAEPSVSPVGSRQSQPPPMAPTASPQLEIISSKLDAIRAMLTSLEMRLANLEKIARGEEEQKRYY